MSIRTVLDGILSEAVASRPADNTSNGEQASKKIEQDVTKQGAIGGNSHASRADKTGELAAKDGTDAPSETDKIEKGRGTEVQGNVSEEKDQKDCEDEEAMDETCMKISDKVKSKIAEGAKYSVDLTSAMSGLFEQQELSPEFAKQAVEIFESAVNDTISARLESINEAAAEIITSAIREEVELLEAKVDEYLSTVVAEWVEDNRVALVKASRADLAESFMENLKGLLESHYVEIPEGKTDLYERAIEAGEEVLTRLQESEKTVAELQEQLTEANKKLVVESFVSGLNDLQAEKIRSLSESITFDDAAVFVKSLQTLSEGYAKAKTSDEAVVVDHGAIVEQEDSQVSTPAVDPVMAAASSFLSKHYR